MQPFEFWRQCGSRCLKYRCCLGDPYDCFKRHHAALPRDFANWRQADVLLGTTGTGTAEQALRAYNLSMPGKVQPESIGPPPSRKADAAAPAVVAAPAVDASRYAASTLKLPWTSPSEFIAGLEKLFGKELVASLTGKVQPEQVGPSPSLQPDAEALPLVPHLTLPASPDTGSAAQPLPAAGPSEPPAWRWTGPLNPPQATCDEQGRLIIPDRTEYNERVRRGMSGEQLWRRMD